MEPSLKVRLLGAAVLIALAVIFIPMLFSGSNEITGPSLNAPAPPDQQLQTRTLQVGPGAASAGSSTAAAVADPDHVATLDLDKAGAQPATATLAAASSGAPAVSSVPAQAGPARTEPAKTAALSGTGPAAQPLPGGAGAAATLAYTINLGVYADRANADRLIANARKQGFSASGAPETLHGKPVTRVRVGPFASRAAAEAARLKLKAAEPGVPMAVEAGAATQTADATPAALPAGKPGGWAVQLGAFNNQNQANMLRDRLRQQGFDGYVDSVSSAGGTLWRVRAGPVTARDAAETLRAQIAQRMKINGLIVTQSR